MEAVAGTGAANPAASRLGCAASSAHLDQLRHEPAARLLCRTGKQLRRPQACMFALRTLKLGPRSTSMPPSNSRAGARYLSRRAGQGCAPRHEKMLRPNRACASMYESVRGSGSPIIAATTSSSSACAPARQRQQRQQRGPAYNGPHPCWIYVLDSWKSLKRRCGPLPRHDWASVRPGQPGGRSGRTPRSMIGSPRIGTQTRQQTSGQRRCSRPRAPARVAASL